MKLDDVKSFEYSVPPPNIRIAVSACLLGDQVRYDGGHKRDRFVADFLADYVEYVRLCPEVELGLGTPRETLRLVNRDGDVRMETGKSGKDHTKAMRDFADKKAASLKAEDLSGAILKSKSPSCGVFRVKVYNDGGMSETKGRGLFAEALIRAYPQLPIEEDGRLNDPKIREHFVERVFAYRRLCNVFKADWKARDLVEFHTREKLLLMAYSPQGYRDLGKIVGTMSDHDSEEVKVNYCTRFMEALQSQTTRGRHVNVMEHMIGYFSDELDSGTRADLDTHIENYRKGIVALLVPLTLIRHCVRLYKIQWLLKQSYLEPQPNELMLRNQTEVMRSPKSDSKSGKPLA